MGQEQLGQARDTARREGLRERTVCYVTRGRVELLVFEHTEEYRDAGVQAPGGGLEAGEPPAQAATREVFEETGLTGLSEPVYLLSQEHVSGEKRQMNHFYWLEAPAGTPDVWEHLAEGRYIFRHRFAPIDRPGLDWEMGTALPALRRLLNELSHDLPEHAEPSLTGATR